MGAFADRRAGRRTATVGLLIGLLGSFFAARRSRARSADGRPAGGLDILHLAFEDHRRPGSGGGGIRTHEINRRLAANHRVTVVTTRFPGARRRTEDGVTYRPLGLPLGYYGSILTYHLCTPFLLLWRRPDLVVEDFAAPSSSTLVPLWTPQPTIAVVQWLFAAETSRRYRVPFYLAEGWGVRLHRNFVAVSAYMAEEIRALNPGACVDVVYAGVDPVRRGGGGPKVRTAGIVYLGRLQAHAKGLDLLLSAFARLSEDVPDVRLTLAGDGPYRAQLEALAVSLGVAGRVSFPGRVEGDAKWELLQRAAVVAVPSRFESFGLVALEALAAGTPVVGFDLPALREIVTAECGLLVTPFDVGRFAEALADVLSDPARVEAMGVVARARADLYSWDTAAAAQEKAYLAAVERDRGRRRSS
ncbi:MAG: glycosyltransferase family 4 protein [Acidimicrobiales bacterium]